MLQSHLLRYYPFSHLGCPQILPNRFELLFQGPKPCVLDRYTMGVHRCVVVGVFLTGTSTLVLITKVSLYPLNNRSRPPRHHNFFKSIHTYPIIGIICWSDSIIPHKTAISDTIGHVFLVIGTQKPVERANPPYQNWQK
jgi:hypothetical protein